MFLSIFNSLFPVAFVIFLGWFAGFKNIVNKMHRSSFANYVMEISFPCLLFTITSTTNPHHFDDFKIITLFLIALMGMYTIAALVYKFLLRSSLAECGQGAFVCAFPDMAFMGIPIFSALFGQDALILIAIGNIIASLVMIPITLILLETKQQSGIIYKNLIFSLVKKPLFIAPMLGVAFSLLRIHLPSIMQSGLHLIGSTTSGVSLFTLGLIISSCTIKLNKKVILNIALKNVFHPLLMMALVFLFSVKGLTAREGILLCAMPTAAMSAMFALKYGVFVEESSSSVILGTLTAFVTLFIFMLIVDINF